MLVPTGTTRDGNACALPGAAASLSRPGPSTSSGCRAGCRGEGKAYGILSLSKDWATESGILRFAQNDSHVSLSPEKGPFQDVNRR